MEQSAYLFSILICTTTDRKPFLVRLLKILQPQVKKYHDVEILVNEDDGKKSIGTKRNELVAKARGKYIAFVDDDDLVSCDYVDLIMKTIESSEPDCIGIHLLHFNDGVLGGFTYHSLAYTSWHENTDTSTGFKRYYRNPNHLNPIRRDIAVKVPFPKTSWGEDRDYSKNILLFLHKEFYIVEPIYYYLFRSKK